MNSRRAFSENNIGGWDYLRNMVQLPFYLQNSALRRVKLAQQTATRRMQAIGGDDFSTSLQRSVSSFNVYMYLISVLKPHKKLYSLFRNLRDVAPIKTKVFGHKCRNHALPACTLSYCICARGKTFMLLQDRAH